MSTLLGAAIHSTAIVETGDIGEDSTVGPFCVIEPNVRIGRGCRIGQGCHIQEGVILSDRIQLGDGVTLWQGVCLEEGVFVGPHAVFTHVLNPRTESYPPEIDQILQTKVGRGASIGANATLLCGHIIGPYAVIGAGATVTHSVRAHEVVLGNPARHQGWVCECGEPLFDIRLCTRCSRSYEMIDTGLRPVGHTEE